MISKKFQKLLLVFSFLMVSTFVGHEIYAGCDCGATNCIKGYRDSANDCQYSCCANPQQ